MHHFEEPAHPVDVGGDSGAMGGDAPDHLSEIGAGRPLVGFELSHSPSWHPWWWAAMGLTARWLGSYIMTPGPGHAPTESLGAPRPHRPRGSAPLGHSAFGPRDRGAEAPP